jgi:L-asparaginase/Glu-tRNA(Gln) amidotransferase subunit D
LSERLVNEQTPALSLPVGCFPAHRCCYAGVVNSGRLVAWSLLPMPDDAQAEMGPEHPSLPLVVILAMGGTIAGKGDRRNKPHTTRVAAFQSPDFGALGHVLDGQVDIRLVTTSADPGHIGFSLAGLTKLPRVDILYAHANNSRDLVDAAVRGP